VSVARVILLGEADEQGAVDVLDAEGREAGVRVRVGEGADDLEVLSKMSTRSLWKSVANRTLPCVLVPAASSLKTAPLLDRSAPIMPSRLSTAGFQPMMVPSSVENSTLAGALVPSWLMTKSDVVLLTWPFGVAVLPWGLPGGVGRMTGLPRTAPWALSRIASPEPLAETRNCPCAVSVKPQGLRRSESVWGAKPGMLETRLVWR
jgi:hypothetical protein